MHDTAAHLVDRVLPDVPYRQWVLSLPRPLRFLLAYRPQLVRPVLQMFLRAVFVWQRRKVRRAGVVGGRPGAVTFIQRFGSPLNLNIHCHALLPDGVFARDEAGSIRFVPVGPPSRRAFSSCSRRLRHGRSSSARSPSTRPLAASSAPRNGPSCIAATISTW